MAFGKRENVCWLLQVSGLGQTDYLDRDDYQDYNDDDGGGDDDDDDDHDHDHDDGGGGGNWKTIVFLFCYLSR